jgi:hypothetical protein
MTKRSFGHIRKLPSGKHQASYTSPLGVRVNAPYTFLTRGDASAWLAAQEVIISSGKWVDPAAPTPTPPKSTDFRTYVERHITLQTNSDGPLLRARVDLAGDRERFSQVQLMERCTQCFATIVWMI